MGNLYRADTDTTLDIPTGKRPTQKESRKKLRKTKNSKRNMIYRAILHNNGMTCDEVEVNLELRHQTASCFIRFLTQDGFLHESRLPNGMVETRKTRAGRNAIVWKARIQPIIPKAQAQRNLF